MPTQTDHNYNLCLRYTGSCRTLPISTKSCQSVLLRLYAIEKHESIHQYCRCPYLLILAWLQRVDAYLQQSLDNRWIKHPAGSTCLLYISNKNLNCRVSFKNKQKRAFFRSRLALWTESICDFNINATVQRRPLRFNKEQYKETRSLVDQRVSACGPHRGRPIIVGVFPSPGLGPALQTLRVGDFVPGMFGARLTDLRG